MTDTELANRLEARAVALRIAAAAMRDRDAKGELLRIVETYEEQAGSLRERGR